ncbi:MAG: YfhO family protein [Candidatus Obscuribacterales bacterium]
MTDFSQKRSTAICLAVITIVIVSVFAKTIFFGKPVSKTFATSSMDSLYYPQVKAVNISSPIDPCIYFFQMPTAISVERIWKQGQIPLWNPNNACGHPIMANIESGVFSWHHFLFPSSSEYLYNLGIIARLIVAAMGTFFLTRSFKVQSKFATVAGLTYALCPHILREVELTKENWSFPWILLLFMSCGRQPSLKHLVILATSCGLICATIHPECSFNLIMLGCLMVTLQRSLESTSATIIERGKTAMASASWLLLVGICVFCVAAPVLLPFAEFMRNSDCYKFEECTPPTVSLAALLLTLIHPAMSGASPFLSIFCIPASILAFYKPRREIIALLICAVLTIGTESLVGPLAELFRHKPFNMLEPIYLLPVCMLLLACLMAEGWQKLASSQGKTPVLLFSTTCLALAAVPPILSYMQVPLSSLDWEVDKYTLVWSAWKRDCAITLASCLLFALSRIRKKSSLAVDIVMVTALLSQLTVSRLSLPVHDSFAYRPTGPVPWLQEHPGRSLAMGRHFIIPNINLVWDLSDFRHFNGLYPPRYLDFQSLCGGRRYFATHYRYEDSLTNAVDLASVKYLTSRSPVFNGSELRAELVNQLQPLAAFQQDFAIAGTSINYDRNLRQAFCLLSWRGASNMAKSQKIQFATLNENDDEVWSSDEFAMDNGDTSIPEVSQIGRWAIPKNNADQPLKLAIRVNNLWSNQPLWPLTAAFGAIKNNAIVATINPTALESPQNLQNKRHFNLIEELPDGSRIYENTHALPEAYTILSDQVVFAQNQAQSRKLITSETFEPLTTAVIEGQNQTNGATQSESKAKIVPARLTRPNSNQVEIETDLSEPAYLVLTDSFYPGWKAYLNGGKEQLNIQRANYLFRAVKVPKGRNTTVFKYEPESLTTGFILFILVIGTLTVLSAWQKVKKRSG